jgi:hypothetical protein
MGGTFRTQKAKTIFSETHTGKVTLHDLTLPCQASEARRASARKISLCTVKSLSVSKHVASRSLSSPRRCFREHCVNRFMAPGVFKDRSATIFKCQGTQTLQSFEMSGTVKPATRSHNPTRPISSTLHLCYENQPDNAVQINKSNHLLSHTNKCTNYIIYYLKYVHVLQIVLPVILARNMSAS